MLQVLYKRMLDVTDGRALCMAFTLLLIADPYHNRAMCNRVDTSIKCSNSRLNYSSNDSHL